MSVPKPPETGKPRTHVCRKDGESLAEIAKRYGHKDAKAILKANGSLAKKRGKALDGLKKGDRLEIPLSPKEMKRHAELHNRRITLAAKVAAAEWEIRRAKRMAAAADKARDEVEGWFDAATRAEKDRYKDVTNTAKAVDTIKKMTDLKRDLIKNIHKPYKRGNMGPKELQTVLGDMAYGEFEDKVKAELTKKGYELLEDTELVAVHAMRAADESYSNIQKPSFWAKTGAMLASVEDWDWDNALTHWYDAVTYDVKEAHERQLDKLRVMRRKSRKLYQDTRDRNGAWLAKCSAWRTEFLAEIGRIDAELKDLGGR